MQKPRIGDQSPAGPSGKTPIQTFDPMAGIPGGPTPSPFPAMTPGEVDAYVGDTPGAPVIAMPEGSGGQAFPPPAGPNGESPTFDGSNYNTSNDSLIPLMETICVTCQHGMVIQAAAPTHNRKGPEFGDEEGQPFTWDYGVCTFVTPPMPLENLKPIKCSKYLADVQIEEPRKIVGTDATPHRDKTEVAP